jgi:hypothetical protein
LVNVQRGARTRVPHLRLRVLHIGTSHFQPGCVRCSQTSPVHPGQLQGASCGLDEPYEYVVVAERTAGLNSLKNEVMRAVGLHDLVLANGVASPNLDSQSLKPMDALEDAAVHANGCAGCFTFRCPQSPRQNRSSIVMKLAPISLGGERHRTAVRNRDRQSVSGTQPSTLLYPKHAHYKGQGASEDANNFECR